MDFDLADGSVTEVLGRALARALPDGVRASPRPAGSAQPMAAQKGAVVYLRGELGAGKTTCARSLLRALGVAGLVRSPTYTLVETYHLPGLVCVHVDLYRLAAPSQVDELGLRDAVGPGCVCLVEWPERGGSAVPRADLDLLLEYAGEARRARLVAMSALGAEWLGNLDTTLA